MYRIIKRLFDFVMALLALTVLSPLLIPVIIGLLLTGEHYVFYFQERIGKGGKAFDIWKFATMLKNSPNIGTGTVTTRNDPRVLPMGKFLRKTKINELPQLINILIGNMSIIGPRPLVKKTYDLYADDVKECISQVTPGLSGIGSVIFRDEEYYVSKAKNPVEFARQYIQPQKGELEKWYYHNRSLYVDFMIIFLTCWVIVFPKSDLVYKVFKTLPRLDLEKDVETFNANN
ncbi:MAG: sugar transferase [Bacteroidales bacterium]|nr:sugar transferase [Bacteroidales bacterium]